MNTKRHLVGLSIAAALVATLLVVGQSPAQVKQGKTRAIKTKQLMKGIVAAQCGALKESLDKSPADDEAWEDVALHAALLNEVSYNLMDDGRCPDGDWKTAAETLRSCSEAVLKAVEGKDLDGAKGAFGELTKACAACHKVHKK